MHFRGTPKQLDPLAHKLLGVSLKEIQSVFAKP
jgi:hypothetical protein